jgi:hypothetical protein
MYCNGTMDGLVMDHNKVYSLIVTRGSCSVELTRSIASDNQGGFAFVQFGNLTASNLTITNQRQDSVLFVVYSSSVTCDDIRITGGQVTHIAGLAASEGPCAMSLTNAEILATRAVKSMFSVMGGDLAVENCSLTDTSGHDSDMFHSVNGSITLTDVTITGYQPKPARAPLIRVEFGRLKVVRVNFSDVRFPFISTKGSPLSVDGCVVSSVVVIETDRPGESVAVISAGRVRGAALVTNCVFTDTFAPFGVIAVTEGALMIDNCTFRNNTGGKFGVIRDQSSSLRIADCAFSHNRGKLMASVLYSLAPDVTIMNSSFDRNGNGMNDRDQPAVFLAASEVLLDEVVVGNGQKGFLVSETRKQEIEIANSQFGDHYENAIIAPNSHVNVRNSSFNCRFRCGPPGRWSREESHIYDKWSKRFEWSMQAPESRFFAPPTKFPDFWEYYVVPWLVVALAWNYRRRQRKVKVD